MTFWKKLPIGLQFSLLLLLSVLIGIACAYQIGQKIYLAESRNQARTVADMVDNVGTWASQYKGVWVKSEPKNPKFKVGSFLEKEVHQAVVSPGLADELMSSEDVQELEMLMPAYHRKNPALVQRELSDVTHASSSKAKFRMTSDKFMNPNNAPNRFESAAIDSLKLTGSAEYIEVSSTGRELFFARKIIATAACLSCHESAAKAPAAVRTRYGETNGFGYRVGEVAGVISVVIPLEYSIANFYQGFDWVTWVGVSAFAASILIIFIYVQRSIIRPVILLKKYAEKAVNSDIGDDIGKLQFVENERSSRNEVHRLSSAIKAMYASIRLLNRANLSQDKVRSL